MPFELIQAGRLVLIRGLPIFVRQSQHLSIGSGVLSITTQGLTPKPTEEVSYPITGQSQDWTLAVLLPPPEWQEPQ